MANYTLTDKEQADARVFLDEHRDSCSAKTTLVEKIVRLFTRKEKDVHRQFLPCRLPSYVMTPTGIGVAVKVRCPICNEEKDVTDYSVW